MFLTSLNPSELKIGIYRSSSIGDVVLATACLSLLDELEIPIYITWIGKNPSIELIQKGFPQVRCIELTKSLKNKQLLDSLSDLDFLLDLQTNIKSRYLCLEFKRKYKRPIYKVNKKLFDRLSSILKSKVLGRKRHVKTGQLKEAEYQFELMANALKSALSHHIPKNLLKKINVLNPKPRLPTYEQKIFHPWQKELKYGVRWLCVAPGASYETKRAPISLLSNIILEVRDKFYSRCGSADQLGLLFLGNAADRQVAINLQRELGWNDPLINLAGKLSLWETALALTDQKCLLSNDSALGHIAESVLTPAVILFGPTAESFGFAPHLASSKAFSSPIGCRPCSKHGKASCRFSDKLCFTSLPVNPISEYIIQLLQVTDKSYRKKHDRASRSSIPYHMEFNKTL